MTKKSKDKLVLTLGYSILMIGCLLVVPLSWMVITSLKSMADITLSKGLALFPSGPTLENFVNIWKEYPIATYIKNSVITVGGSTLFSVSCAALCGYGVSRYEFKGKEFLLSFLLITQMFPAVMKIMTCYLFLEGSEGAYHFYYGQTEREMIPLVLEEDGSLPSTVVADGFVGAYMGMYASSCGAESDNYADFDWFRYEIIED